MLFIKDTVFENFEKPIEQTGIYKKYKLTLQKKPNQVMVVVLFLVIMK